MKFFTKLFSISIDMRKAQAKFVLMKLLLTFQHITSQNDQTYFKNLQIFKIFKVCLPILRCYALKSYIFVIEYWPRTIFNLTLSQILAENFFTKKFQFTILSGNSMIHSSILHKVTSLRHRELTRKSFKSRLFRLVWTGNESVYTIL